MRGLRELVPFRLARGAEKELIIGGALLVLGVGIFIKWPSFPTFLLMVPLILVFCVLVYFFRDPGRISPVSDRLFLGPADGRVMAVERVHEPLFIQGEALRISIFMSLLDVHVNRAPIDGRVVFVQHVPGQFLQAFRPEASELNEHNLIGLDSRYGSVLVKQIAGIMARRVVSWVQPDQRLGIGERLGVIKFGSRVDLFLSPEAEPVVQVDDRVRAGVTVVAQWKRGSDE